MGGLFGGAKPDTSAQQESIKLQKEQLTQAQSERDALQKQESDRRRSMLTSRRRGSASLLSGSETGEDNLSNTLG